MKTPGDCLTSEGLKARSPRASYAACTETTDGAFGCGDAAVGPRAMGSLAAQSMLGAGALLFVAASGGCAGLESQLRAPKH